MDVLTFRIGSVIVIDDEAPQQCDQCGTIAELRPYGPGGQVICWDCAQKDPAGTEARMNHVLYGDPL